MLGRLVLLRLFSLDTVTQNVFDALLGTRLAYGSGHGAFLSLLILILELTDIDGNVYFGDGWLIRSMGGLEGVRSDGPKVTMLLVDDLYLGLMHETGELLGDSGFLEDMLVVMFMGGVVGEVDIRDIEVALVVE